VLGNLGHLGAGHPDLAALAALKRHRRGEPAAGGLPPVGFPPMVAAGYRALIAEDAAAEPPGTLADGSLAERAAVHLLAAGPWSRWSALDKPVAVVEFPSLEKDRLEDLAAATEGGLSKAGLGRYDEAAEEMVGGPASGAEIDLPMSPRPYPAREGLSDLCDDFFEGPGKVRPQPPRSISQPQSPPPGPPPPAPPRLDLASDAESLLRRLAAEPGRAISYGAAEPEVEAVISYLQDLARPTRSRRVSLEGIGRRDLARRLGLPLATVERAVAALARRLPDSK
jgi:hypothetical protein